VFQIPAPAVCDVTSWIEAITVVKHLLVWLDRAINEDPSQPVHPPFFAPPLDGPISVDKPSRP